MSTLHFFKLFMIFIIVSLIACDNDGLTSTESALLNYNPEQVVFNPVSSGESEERTITIENLGRSSAVLREFSITENAELFELSVQESDESEAIALPPEVSIDPNQTINIVVKYQAENIALSGNESLVFSTNIRNQSTINIPIILAENEAEILVNPNNVSFDLIDAGEQAEKLISVINLGNSPLIISSLTMSGSEDFSVKLAENEMSVGEAFSGQLDTPIVIESQATIKLAIIYAPPLAGPDTGTLTITSNDLNSSEINVPITAAGSVACIQVSPESVNFINGLILEDLNQETPNVEEVRIESCGASPLTIKKIEIEGANFALTQPIEAMDDGTLFILPPADDSGILPSRGIEVGFWPLDVETYGGRMLIYSNLGPDPIVVELFGRGTDNQCPIPEVIQEQYDVAPLDIITLDGSPSVDLGDEVTRWVWNVVDRPQGSVSQIVEAFDNIAEPAEGGDADDEGTAQALFFVDLAGRYVIELEVYDSLGLKSCEPKALAQVIIEAIPDKDLHIQMVWSTPADPDETDESGTDVDLHFKHENSGNRWASSAGDWDCSFSNPNPEWGSEEEFRDNPILDIDDTNGAGPENINLDLPEIDKQYEVGAIYFRAESGFGEDNFTPMEHLSYVTIRLFARGDLLAEFSQELDQVGQLWHAASIVWCEDLLQCPQVIPQERVYQEGSYPN
jgi:hypothetical protein